MAVRPLLVSTPEEAKSLLMEGNERFQNGNILVKDYSFNRRRELAHKGQFPIGVIVSCSDSRVPAEILFDQALGDLFVVRVAGNVVTPAELGSIEYAVEFLEVPLVLVLGHENCGAITAAVEGGELPGSIGVLAKEIAPSLQKAKENHTNASEEFLVKQTTELNVFHTIDKIKQSPVIQSALGRNLEVCGGMYHLESGHVEWLT